MFSINFKEGVIVHGFSRELLIAYVNTIFIFIRHDSELTITSVFDGVHSVNSKHNSGNAFDIRTRHLTADYVKSIADDIRKSLTKDYDIVIESNHIHIEYDPKRY